MVAFDQALAYVLAVGRECVAELLFEAEEREQCLFGRRGAASPAAAWPPLVGVVDFDELITVTSSALSGWCSRANCLYASCRPGSSGVAPLRRPSVRSASLSNMQKSGSLKNVPSTHVRSRGS